LEERVGGLGQPKSVKDLHRSRAFAGSGLGQKVAGNLLIVGSIDNMIVAA
jgi:hypothetical protein